MKLIHGKTHDYYDVVAKYGHSTEGNTYLRKPETVSVKHDKQYSKSKGWHYSTNANPLSFMISDSVNYYEPYYRLGDKQTATISTIKILFCGKLYKVIKIIINGEIDYCYDVESVQKIFAAHDTILPERDKKQHEWYIQNNLMTVEFLNRYFAISDYTETAIENKYVTAIFDYKKFSRNGIEIELNGRLDTYQFYKVLDPYTAYQTLSQYIDGQLTYPGNINVDIPDEYKIESKGFDKRYSFRTRPKV